MKTKRIITLENALDNFYEHWKSVRKETITHLGEEDALHLIDFHANNWLDISTWISSQYSRKEQMNIVDFQFLRLFKEIYWLQFLFLTGNYSTVYRNLRYTLEMISQAHYIDLNYHDLTLDEQIEKMKVIEEEIYGWKLISNVLCEILDSDKEKIQNKYKPLWNRLNKHVHPSAKEMDNVASKDFSSLIIDSFNESLSRKVLADTNKIFDIVYAVIFKKFPKIKDLALKYKFINQWKNDLPNTMYIICNNKQTFRVGK
jgi:hypothetical protein